MQLWQLFDWVLDNVASPVAPARWLERWSPRNPLGRTLLSVLKGLAVVIWAVGLVGVWFLAFWVLLIWEAVASPHRPTGAEEKPTASVEKAVS